VGAFGVGGTGLRLFELKEAFMENVLTPRDPHLKGSMELVKPSESFHKRVRLFFDEYGAAFKDPKKIASCYGDCAIAADPNFVECLKGEKEILTTMKEISAYQEKTGLRSMTPTSLEIGEIAPPFYMTKINWGALFEKTGNKLITFDVTYLIREYEEGFQIITSVSHEEEHKVREELGLLN
jgi:hypothetical protein